jgi:parvulin-like peptidyl-prolyl isomerase
MDRICLRRISMSLGTLTLAAMVVSTARAQAPSSTSPASPAPTPSAGSPAGVPGAPTLQSPESEDKVVLKVGSQQFTKAELDFLFSNLAPQAQRAVQTQGKKPFGDQFALVIMLSQQAHLHHLDETPAFVHKLELQKDQLGAQAAYEEINQKAKPAPEEVSQYYTTHAANYDEITVRQFVVRVKNADAKVDPAHPTAAAGSGLAPEEAKARAEAIRKEVVAGTDIKKVMEDFKAPGDIIIESEPRKMRRGGMRPETEKVAFALKDGEISEPVELPQALVLLQVTAHNHVELKDATPDIERTLQKEKTDAALADVKKNTTLWMDDQYFAPPPKPTLGPTPGAPPTLTTPKQ